MHSGNMGCGGGAGRSSFREDLVEKPEDFRHVELDVLEVQEMLIVFLLRTREKKFSAEQHNVDPGDRQLTFSSKSSMLRSISNIAFSRPL